MSAGWFPDPTGRFATRYYDGSDWTDQVQGPDGQVVADVLERSSSGLAAPTPTPAPPSAAGTVDDGGWGAAPASGPGWNPPPARAPVAKGTGVLGVAVAGFGWLLAALSLLVLDWVDGGTRGDIADALPDSLPDGLGVADLVSFTYVKWGGLVLLVLVALGLASVLLGLVGRDPTVLRFLVAGFVLVVVVLHAVAVARGLRDGAEVGAHLGTVAYLVVIAGLAVGSHTRRTAT